MTTLAGVHATHCCKRHGCKYGDVDCPVVLGRVKQQYPCEDCEHDPDKSAELISEVKAASAEYGFDYKGTELMPLSDVVMIIKRVL